MNSYTLFDVPQKAFDCIFSKIRHAKKHIYIESFRIANDAIGRALIDLLIEKADAGVTVCIICDDLGWGRFSRERMKRLKYSKIELHIFNPWFKNITLQNIKKYWNIHFRNHRKLTIIDGKYAYVGGMNYSARELRWRDMMVEIRGAILDDLVSSFHEMLGIAKKKHFEKRRIYKKLSRSFYHEDILVRQIPYSKHRLLKKELIKLFDSAQKEICIATPYLVPDLPFRLALKRAVVRGVAIKILIPKKSDSKMADMMNHFGSYVSTQSGIEVFLYPKMMHAKYVIVDSHITSFGSANLDYQTFNHNYELNIISKNKRLTEQLHRSFLRDVKQSETYHEKKWSERLWINKIIMGFLLRHRRHF